MFPMIQIERILGNGLDRNVSEHENLNSVISNDKKLIHFLLIQQPQVIATKVTKNTL